MVRKTLVVSIVSLLILGFQTTSSVSAQTPTVLQGHTSAVTLLAWSPDGELLASAAGGFASIDNRVRIWRKDGTQVAILLRHPGPIQSLAWSPDGKWLVAGSADKTISWSTPGGAFVRVIDTHVGTVYALAWSPNSQTLVSGSIADPTHNIVQFWDLNGNLLKTLSTPFSGGKFYNLGWSPDGKYLVGGATSYTEWRADGTPVFSYDSCEHCTPAWGFAWSPDSSRWAIGDEGGGIQIYTVTGEKYAVRNANSSVDTLAWSPDGQILAGGNVYFWDPNGKIIGGLTPGHATTNIAWSPDSKYLATSDSILQDINNNIQLWKRDGARWLSLSGHAGPVDALAWSPDGKILASGSVDETIRLWTVQP